MKKLNSFGHYIACLRETCQAAMEYARRLRSQTAPAEIASGLRLLKNLEEYKPNHGNIPIISALRKLP
jgi:hypothetical protein